MTESSEARNSAPSETLALLYLAAPVGVFLVAAVLPALAWPATALLGYTLWRSGRHTAWRLHGPGLVASIAALGLSLGWVFASGNLGVLQANEDWSKHHALLNLLASKPWWPADDAGTLRYSLGWYLLPALAMKGVGGHGALFSALWSVLGLLLFCQLIAPIFSSCRRYLAGIVAFAAFAGGDLFGTLMTGYRSHIPFHLEWWSAWIQYSGTTTALFWTPQHALPAWIGIGLFMRQWAPMQPPQTTAPSPALVVALALFWSPFAALGLLPFAVLLLSQQWRRGWPIDGVGLIAALVIAVPLLVFLQTDTAEIPKAFIWNSRCVMSGGSCFSWSGLVFFLLVETGGAALVLWACRDRARQAFNLLALGCLCLIPLLRMGVYSDFAMRASLPALCVLALACARALTTTTLPAARRWVPALVLLIGAPVPLSELYRGATVKAVDYRARTLAQEIAGRESLRSQYFAQRRPWVLRSP